MYWVRHVVCRDDVKHHWMSSTQWNQHVEVGGRGAPGGITEAERAYRV